MVFSVALLRTMACPLAEHATQSSTQCGQGMALGES